VTRSTGRLAKAIWGRRRSLSLRARLLTGLIALTAIFLVVMGVVSIVVLGTLEQNQSAAELRLAARQPVVDIAKATDGFAAAYLSLRTGEAAELTPGSAAGAELQGLLDELAGKPRSYVASYLRALAVRDEPFGLASRDRHARVG
jgi:hypothetical protein